MKKVGVSVLAKKVASAWPNPASPYCWGNALAAALGVVSLETVNRELGGQYRWGWREDEVSGSRCEAGDKLWELIKQSKPT